MLSFMNLDSYKTMKMVKAFNVSRIASTIFCLDFDLIWRKACARCFFRRYSCCAI
jgi:hypothetical protein